MTSRGLLRCIAIGLGICTLSGWIPDDFIDVDDEEVSEVTVIYQDKFLTQVVARFDNDTIEILNLEVLENALPESVQNKKSVTQALRKIFPHQKEALCSDYEGVCEYPATYSATIIFDREQYKLYLFIAPEYLNASSSLESLQFTIPTKGPPATSGYSSYQVTATSNYLRLLADNELSWSQNENAWLLSSQLTGNFNFNENSKNASIYINDVLRQKIKQTLRYQAGIFNTPGTSFFTSNRIYGVGVKTHRDLLQNYDSLLQNPIDVTIRSPSLVTVYKDKQVLLSQNFHVGIHQLNTASFPDGNYTITIEIEGADGSKESSQQTFLKNSKDPIEGWPTKSLAFGLISENETYFPKPTSKPVLTASYYYRQNPLRSIFYDAKLDSDTIGGSIGIGQYWRNFYIRPYLGLSSENGILYALNGSIPFEWQNILFHFSAVGNKSDDGNKNNYINVSGRYTHPYLGLFSIEYTTGKDDPLQYQLSKNTHFTLAKNSRFPIRGRMNVILSKNDSALSLQFNKKLSDTSMKTEAFSQQNYDVYGTDLRSHTTGIRTTRDLSKNTFATAGALFTDAGIDIATSVTRKMDKSSIQLTGDYQAGNGFLFDINMRYKDSLGFIITDNKTYILEDMDSSTGALVTLETKNDPSTFYAKSLQKTSYFSKKRKQTFLPLEPFKSAEIYVDSEQLLPTFTQQDIKKVTLYPYNITHIHARSVPMHTLITQLICEDEIIANTFVESQASTTVTDEFGYIDIEVLDNDSLTARKDNHTYTFTLPKEKPEDGLIYTDTLTCSSSQSTPTHADDQNSATIATEKNQNSSHPHETKTTTPHDQTTTPHNTETQTNLPILNKNKKTHKALSPIQGVVPETSTTENLLFTKESGPATDTPVETANPSPTQSINQQNSLAAGDNIHLPSSKQFKPEELAELRQSLKQSVKEHQSDKAHKILSSYPQLLNPDSTFTIMDVLSLIQYSLKSNDTKSFDTLVQNCSIETLASILCGESIPHSLWSYTELAHNPQILSLCQQALSTSSFYQNSVKCGLTSHIKQALDDSDPKLLETLLSTLSADQLTTFFSEKSLRFKAQLLDLAIQRNHPRLIQQIENTITEDQWTSLLLDSPILRKDLLHEAYQKSPSSLSILIKHLSESEKRQYLHTQDLLSEETPIENMIKNPLTLTPPTSQHPLEIWLHALKPASQKNLTLFKNSKKEGLLTLAIQNHHLDAITILSQHIEPHDTAKQLYTTNPTTQTPWLHSLVLSELPPPILSKILDILPDKKRRSAMLTFTHNAGHSLLHQLLYQENQEDFLVLLPYLTQEDIITITSQTNTQGWNMLHIASVKGLLAILESLHTHLPLENYNLLLEQKDIYQQTPIDICHNKEIEQWLINSVNLH